MMLTYNPATHEYFWDSQPVPSVTRILQQVVNYSGVPAEVLERKRQIGEAVHQAIALDLANDLDEESVVEPWAGYFQGWRRFMRETGFEPALCEHRVYHRQYGYAGTLDICGRLKGKCALLDIKTSAEVHPSAALQTAAYAAALEDQDHIKTNVRYALQLKDDGSYELHLHKGSADFQVFLALLSIYNWRKRNQL